jgi:hypothetical protein
MNYSSRRTLALISAILGILIIATLSVSFTPTPRVYATDPTMDAALFTLAQATAQAQQTKDAREQEAVNQRGTTTAIENAQRQANATATRQTQLTRQAADATATRISANATSTQVSVNATLAKQSANATATMESLRVMQTQVAITTTATAEAISANATATAIARQQQSEDRDATIKSAGIVVAIIGLVIVVVLLVTVLTVLLIQTIRRGFVPKIPTATPSPPQVVFVQPPPPAIVVDDPAMIEEITRALRESEEPTDDRIITLPPTEYDAQ